MNLSTLLLCLSLSTCTIPKPQQAHHPPLHSTPQHTCKMHAPCTTRLPAETAHPLVPDGAALHPNPPEVAPTNPVGPGTPHQPTSPPRAFVALLSRPLKHDSRHITKTGRKKRAERTLLSYPLSDSANNPPQQARQLAKSCVAQRKRAGLITRRSLDRNESQLGSWLFFCVFPFRGFFLLHLLFVLSSLLIPSPCFNFFFPPSF